MDGKPANGSTQIFAVDAGVKFKIDCRQLAAVVHAVDILAVADKIELQRPVWAVFKCQQVIDRAALQAEQLGPGAQGFFNRVAPAEINLLQLAAQAYVVTAALQLVVEFKAVLRSQSGVVAPVVGGTGKLAAHVPVLRFQLLAAQAVNAGIHSYVEIQLLQLAVVAMQVQPLEAGANLLADQIPINTVFLAADPGALAQMQIKCLRISTAMQDKRPGQLLQSGIGIWLVTVQHKADAGIVKIQLPVVMLCGQIEAGGSAQAQGQVVQLFAQYVGIQIFRAGVELAAGGLGSIMKIKTGAVAARACQYVVGPAGEAVGQRVVLLQVGAGQFDAGIQLLLLPPALAVNPDTLVAGQFQVERQFLQLAADQSLQLPVLRIQQAVLQRLYAAIHGQSHAAVGQFIQIQRKAGVADNKVAVAGQ